MDFLTSGFNLLLIILGFGLLIFVHELGHFLAAKWAGIRTEAFAVGMGPVMLAWRRGLGLRFGSTAAEYEKRVREHMRQDPKYQLNSRAKPDATADDEPHNLPPAEFYRIGDQIGLGETEYSLRWLPIGGFVKMLGQEDANPNYVSNDPRSYTSCPVGKRMIVVSAGVVMNILLAILLFIVAFMIGVRFEAPVVGDVAATAPAGQTRADNAEALGVETVGLQPGDEVIAIDGKPARTFADLQIASAMSRPGVPVQFTVRRAGLAQPLQFTLAPEKDPVSGLLSVGLLPGASATLEAKDKDGYVQRFLRRANLADAGVEPGMQMVSANGIPVQTYGQISRIADETAGEPLQTKWESRDRSGAVVKSVSATLRSRPEFIIYRQVDGPGDEGILGLAPLVRIADVPAESPNTGILEPGDLVVRVDDIAYPRFSQFLEKVRGSARRTIEITVIRNGERRVVPCTVNRSGQLMVEITPAHDTLVTAQPILQYGQPAPDEARRVRQVPTPIASANLFTTGGTQVLEVNGQSVENWRAFREQLQRASVQALERGESAEVQLLVADPTPARVQEHVTLTLSSDEVKELHALGWQPELPSVIFEPLQVTLTANGNPLTAVSMGFAETKKLVVMTYLTIDRLIRGSVGVDQLRGPVGIIHIGTKVADRGLLYLIFLLGMISVNLAVINFLPIPIVDGGLFLFLVYEKFKGRPPSLAFQNAATVVGLALIGTLFLVTFYNDVLRLIG